MVMAYIVVCHYSYGQYSYGLYSLYSYGLYSYGLYSYGLYSYGESRGKARKAPDLCVCISLSMDVDITVPELRPKATCTLYRQVCMTCAKACMECVHPPRPGRKNALTLQAITVHAIAT